MGISRMGPVRVRRCDVFGLRACSNDLLKYVDNGANVDQRIGNKVKGNYLKGAMTLTAARQQGASSGATNGDQNGESLATATDATSIEQFLRTTWRVVIFKDLQVNSTDPYIGWADVFQNQTVNTGSAAPIGEMGGRSFGIKHLQYGEI